MVKVGKQPSATLANIFMFFLLSYNILLFAILGYFYRNVWHDTTFGSWMSSPWFLIVSQITGLLVPMFIFRSIFGSIEKFRKGNQNNTSIEIDSVDVIYSEPTKRERRYLGFVNILLIVVLSLMVQPTMMIISGLASLIIPNPVVGVMTQLATIPFPMALLIIAIIPSICEEWVFRGYIQSHYEGYNILVTALINGLFFGIIHLNFHQFTYAFIMGMFFVYLVHITRSLFAAVLSHFVINASQLSLSYLVFQMDVDIVAADPTTADLISGIYELIMINIFIFPLALLIFLALIKHNQLRKLEKNSNYENSNGEILETSKTLSEIPRLMHMLNQKNLPNPFDRFFWAVVLLFLILVL